MKRYAFLNSYGMVMEIVEVGDDTIYPQVPGIPGKFIPIPDGMDCKPGWMWDGQKFYDPQPAPPAPEPTPEPTIPQVITPRQCRMQLLQMGLLDDVETLIAASPREDQIAWEYAVEVRRTDALVERLAEQLQLMQGQIDQMFVEAAKL